MDSGCHVKHKRIDELIDAPGRATDGSQSARRVFPLVLLLLLVLLFLDGKRECHWIIVWAGY